MIRPKPKRMLFTLRNLRNLIKMGKVEKQRNLMLNDLHVMNLNILETIAKVSLLNLFQIFTIIIFMDMDITQWIVRNLNLIMIMQIVKILGTLTMHVIEEDLTTMKVEKEEKLFVTDEIILDTLQGIAEHLTTSRMNKEEMYLYVSYVVTLNTQKSSTEWIEET